jgi:hypothetical protein
MFYIIFINIILIVKKLKETNTNLSFNRLHKMSKTLPSSFNFEQTLLIQLGVKPQTFAVNTGINMSAVTGMPTNIGASSSLNTIRDSFPKVNTSFLTPELIPNHSVGQVVSIDHTAPTMELTLGSINQVEGSPMVSVNNSLPSIGTNLPFVGTSLPSVSVENGNITASRYTQMGIPGALIENNVSAATTFPENNLPFIENSMAAFAINDASSKDEDESEDEND